MMPYRPLTDDDPPLAYLDGVALGGGRALVIAAVWGLEDEPDRPTRLLLVGGPAIEYLDINENIIALARLQQPDGWSVWALSKLSTVRRVFPDLGSPIAIGRPNGGRFVTLHSDKGTLFAAGMFGQIASVSPPGEWHPADDGAYRFNSGPGYRMLRGLATATDGTMLAAGLYGDCLVRVPGSAWSDVPVETNVSFERAVFVPTVGQFFVCGDNGTLARFDGSGGGAEWSWIDTATNENFWGSTVFGATLVLSTMNGLFGVRPETGEVTQMQITTDLVAGTYKTDALGGTLWSFGPMDIASFDGNTWTRIAVPGTD